MKIDRHLNLVLKVEREEGPLYVHSTPISEQLFDKYFFTISKTYEALASVSGEYLLRMGPRVAARMLRRVAEADEAWDGPTGIKSGLVAEIRRLSNVLVLSAAGWETIPLQEALDRKFFSQDEFSEIENAIVFFTVCSVSMKRAEANSILTTLFTALGDVVTSLNSSEYQHSLLTLKPGENTGEKVAPSSMPR